MAVPKRRTSKARRDSRRSHDSLAAPTLSVCPRCGEPKLPHRICPSCGAYKGQTVIETEDE